MTIDTARAAGPGRWRLFAAWGLRALLALAFLGAATLKLSGDQKMVAEFGEIGFGQGFRYLTGAIEVAGVALLLWPRSTVVGAIVLLGICAGAFAAQIGPLHGDIVHVIVLGALLVLSLVVRPPAPDRAVAAGG
jgi:uncharacterized membrane protein YphA (DoxX/SURF4 family)